MACIGGLLAAAWVTGCGSSSSDPPPATGGSAAGGGGQGGSSASGGDGGTAGAGGLGGGQIGGAGGAGGVGGAGGSPPNPCNTCHGSSVNPAPPIDTSGQSDTQLPTVGAHQAHVTDRGMYRIGQCEDCHLVPADVGDPGHLDGAPAELTWGAVAQADNVLPDYQLGACSVYCHGATLDGGAVDQPLWTTVDGSQAYCGSCHGLPPPPPHRAADSTTCAPCHSFTGLMPDDPSTHVDGQVDAFPCGSCHAVPPATGAHLRHYGDSSSPALADYGDLRSVEDYYPGGVDYYMFGCGNCHPSDGLLHGDGVVQVQLHDPAAPVDSLKSKNPATASYSGGSCSDVYCHSSGQELPSFQATPPWVGGTLSLPRCAACHGNPPSYPSGGAGTVTANTHVVMGDDGWELGHFGGLPGPWHGSYHGASTEAAAPMTCQTCHYDSVDPSATGPGGFYYLDTTGGYDLGGNLGFDCSNCHSGLPGEPATLAGEIQPLKHVNGSRDVAFDSRTTIPAAVTGLPAPPDRPSRPYWVTATPSPLPPDSTVDGVTWSFHLAGSSYDPATKSCSDVPCHLKQSFGTGLPQYDPMLWGAVPVGMATCNACHQF